MRPAGRIGLTLSDQVVASATNFGIALAATRVLDAEGLGRFGALYAGCWFLQLAVRSYCGDPLVLRCAADPERTVIDSGPAVGAGALVGFVLGIPIVLFGVVVQSLSIVMVAAALPGFLIADTVRSVAIAAGRPARALLVDGSWGAALILLYLIGGRPAGGAMGLIALWMLAANVGAVAGLWRSALQVDLGGGLRWLTAVRRLGASLGVESALLAGFAHLYVVALVVRLGAEEAGVVRAALVMLGPSAVVVGGLLMAAQPEGLRLLARRPHLRRRIELLIVLAAGGVHPAAAIVWSAVPDAWGVALLGSAWHEAAAVVVPLGALLGLVAATAATAVTFRWTNRSVVGALSATVVVSGALCAALVSGGSPRGTTLAATAGAAAGLIVAQMGIRLRRRQPPPHRSGRIADRYDPEPVTEVSSA